MSDCKKRSTAAKRGASPPPGGSSPPAKQPRERAEERGAGDAPRETLRSNGGAGDAHACGSGGHAVGDAPPEKAAGGGARVKEPSDWAAMAAAEALASLTRGDGGGGEAKAKARKHVEAKRKKTTAGKPSSRRASPRAGEAEDSPTTEKGLGKGETTAPADSSTSDAAAAVVDAGGTEVAVGAEEDEDHEEEEEDEGDGDSLSGLSTQSSSSEGPGEPEDTECSIVSVKVAPETRQSVARLAQVQVELEAIEKRATRKYRRMELRFSEMRKPHLDQRGTIIQSIPGFWVTAFLNHPQLSAHIDENDEDALSYMTNLEVDGFKGNKMGYRICFHFSRNPYFQNNIIVKEFHIGMAGSSVSFSNPIFWHRGRNLAAHGKMVKGPGSMRVYQSFFNWFTDHSSPSTDEIAEILKDDLWKNPLRYYLTPVWEPRENGRRADNGNGDECVVISDSEEEGEEEEEEEEMEEEDDDYDDVGAAGDESREEDLSEEGDSSDGDATADREVVIDGSEDSEEGVHAEEEEDDSSDRDGNDEDLDVEELDDGEGGGAPGAKGQEGGDEEDIEVDGEEDG